MVLPLPASRAEIEALQRARKPIAVERARRAPFFEGKLDHVDLEALDDPAEWAKIPILDKEDLRAIANERFYDDFCIAPKEQISEYWRSGGATGKPLFYPRTFEDIRYNMVGFARTYEIAGVDARDTAHLSFPLGIHPAGHMWARAAFELGIGINWVGAGAAAPSALQIELLRHMRPSIWMGMSSYGIHLANLAEANDIDLASSGVRKLLSTAEALSDAKRAKLERMWGAEVFDNFGMTECSMMAGESECHDGFHVWTDLAFIEVLDPETYAPVPEGETGVLVMTPLWSNNATPFLRWNSGDIVSWHAEGATEGPYGVFPMIRHAHRTAGFFKVKGVNIGHQALEDFMFAIPDVNDFKAEVLTDDTSLDLFRLSIEVKKGADAEALRATVAAAVKTTFEITADIPILPTGTLAKEFESSVKAPRFVDKRE